MRAVVAKEELDAPMDLGLSNKPRKGTSALGSTAAHGLQLSGPTYQPLVSRLIWKSRTLENLRSFPLLGLWDLTRKPHNCC